MHGCPYADRLPGAPERHVSTALETADLSNLPSRSGQVQIAREPSWRAWSGCESAWSGHSGQTAGSVQERQCFDGRFLDLVSEAREAFTGLVTCRHPHSSAAAVWPPTHGGDLAGCSTPVGWLQARSQTRELQITKYWLQRAS